MDLNVKLQGPNYFLEFWIYFPVEKGVEYVYGSVDRVHGAGARVYGFFIKWEPSVGGSRVGISPIKQVRWVLIWFVD
jgi:hypothetical protein